MTFQYPVEIAKDLVTITGGFSQQSMEIHGIGLVGITKMAFGNFAKFQVG